LPFFGIVTVIIPGSQLIGGVVGAGRCRRSRKTDLFMISGVDRSWIGRVVKGPGRPGQRAGPV
jgi:hypothetical protein